MGVIPDVSTTAAELLLLESANSRMARALRIARQVADADVPILLTGESGTGKRRLSAAIHQWSCRRDGPLVTLSCDALAEQRLENGLLTRLRALNRTDGRRRRSPNGGCGTLVLDDFGAHPLPAWLQLELLRLLDRGSVEPGTAELDLRVIAISCRDLEHERRSGRLREDLFFRLDVIHIDLPPLRERLEDLPTLQTHLLAQLSARHHRAAPQLTPAAARLLARHEWPGNIRELMSVLERALVLASGDVIDADDLPVSLVASRHQLLDPAVAGVGSLADVEQQQIRLALAQSATLGEAAARLGIDPATLWRKRKRYGLAQPRGNVRAAGR